MHIFPHLRYVKDIMYFSNSRGSQLHMLLRQFLKEFHMANEVLDEPN